MANHAVTGSLKNAKLTGRVEPRLFTPPLRPLTEDTTHGYSVIRFAEAIGHPLLPWQQWLVIHALELNPDGTYRFRTVLTIVARQNGKSDVKRIVSLWRLFVQGARMILGVAQDLALARIQMGFCKDTIVRSPRLAEEYGGERKTNGDEYFWLTDDSLPRKAPVESYPRYLIRALNRSAGRGLSIDELNIDELREQTDWDGWSAVSKTVLARQYAQIWAMSNMGDATSVVLNQLRDAALTGRDELIGLFEWSGPEGCALDDPAAIAQANPGLGHIITLPAILSALGTDPPNVYRTEVLCQRVDILDGPFDLDAWKECGDSAVHPPAERPVAFFDRSEEGHSTLAVAEVGAGGIVQVAVRAAWHDDDDVRSELPKVLTELRPRVLGWYPGGPAGALATLLRPTGKSAYLRVSDGAEPTPNTGRVKIAEVTGVRVSEAVQGFADLMKARRVMHNQDPLLNAHVAGSQKAPSGDGGYKLVRRGGGNVDAAYAAAGAVQLALTNPRRYSSDLKAVS